MKVLITGANGLLGANLVRKLIKANMEVKAFVRPSADLRSLKDVPCQLFRGDIQVYEDLYQALSDCDAIVHAASTTSVLPRDFAYYKNINFNSTKNIVQAVLRQNNKRLVHVSTANVFGPGSKENPGSESSPFTLGHYKSGYINSKYIAQEYVLKKVNEYNLNAVVVNPTFIIGPYDSKPSSGKMILHGLKHGMQWYPSGGKNFVHVHDVAQGIIRALEIGRNGQCYLLAGENLTYREFFSQLNQVSGRKPIQIRIPKGLIRFSAKIADAWSSLIKQPLAFNQSNAQLLCLDNYYTGKKAAQEFGLQTTPVKSGIEEALSWFRKENYISEDNYSTHGTSFDL